MRQEALARLSGGAEALGIRLSAPALSMFGVYAQEVLAGNVRLGLSGHGCEEEIVTKDFLDSLSVVQSGTVKGALIDIGSGAGFPGLPLKIVCADLDLTLLDSSKRKVAWLEALIAKLGVTGAAVVDKRAEDFAREAPAAFTTAVARALAPLPVLIEYAMPLLVVGGALVAQKGRIDEGEMERGRRAADLLGAQVAEPIEVRVPFLEADRHLVVVQKLAPTPDGFPRRPGMAAKKPVGSK